MASKVKIVKKLPNGTAIAKIKRKVTIGEEEKEIVKYTIVKGNDLVTIKDFDGNITGIQFFDTYKVGPNGEVIIGVHKTGLEYYHGVLSHYDLSSTEVQAVEVPGGPFNIGPYAKQYYEYHMPTSTVEEIVPEDLSYNYGLINKDGVLAIYPSYDDMQFSGEGTCIVGRPFVCGELRYGYNDVLTGEAITPVAFDVAFGFSHGRGGVKYRGKYGFVDRNKVMIDASDNDQYADNLYPRYYRATPFGEDGVSFVVLAKGSHFGPALKAKIDTNGDIVGYVTHKTLRKNRITG